ncbi:aromatic acid/H+ symport family MFS transporter [Pseudomonas sp. TH05]|uniref:MFS transporter n=1 Tax=unclassified Pseudomonas TaxID=196821 RepID=UPI0019138815|nr:MULTISPECIES: aromatic acid/H+ symport family MFS transporter [unclassified Pseudomonas]MBK5542260.1 aromatic acid/H+ symport family MFS transporter [Pseudomonas sp. TH07]MBK5559568.1 aromatic acid/H+ symport family MFS transporter [Pseudomonas sp. TH05]
MRKIDSNQLIDEARFNAFHWRVLFWCALIIIFDGYDLVIYGVVLPVLMQEWGLSPLQAGALGSYALFGMMFGALFFGSLSDRIGRKKVIAICVILFSGFTVLNGFASTPTQFGICRFIAGLGIGGVMPNVVALMSEYAPKKMRSTLVAIMFSGYSVGGMLSAGLGIVLLPNFGWQSVFYVAVIPLLLLPLILKFLPESVGFMLRQGREDEARQVLQRIEPSFVPQTGDVFSKAALKADGAPVVQLFRDGRALSTLMLWVAFFCCLLMVYALNSWLPKLMASAGYGLGSSLMFLLVLNFGAIFGAVGGGWIGDRLNLQKVLVAFFVVAALSISLLGFKSPTGLLYGLIAIAGATTIGTQILAYACVAQFYPMAIRSTGLGWASGVGRSGAIVGPILGGALVAIELPLHYNFMAFAIPGAVAALAMCFVYPRQARPAPVAAAGAPSL